MKSFAPLRQPNNGSNSSSNPQRERRGPPRGNADTARERVGQRGPGPFEQPWLNDALGACFGQSLGGLSAAFGVDPRAPGALAATEGTEMRFGGAVSLGRAAEPGSSDGATLETIAHEVAHALGCTTGEDAFDRPGDPGEAQAERAGQGFRRWVEAGFAGTAPRLQPATQGQAQIHRASTSAALTGSPMLRLGSSGDQVKALQSALNQNGASLKVDGAFGALTQAAVISFQRSKGLTADGIVGPQTAAALNGSSSSSTTTGTSTSTSGTSTSGPTTTGTALTGSPMLRLGSSGDQVKALQSALNQNGASLKVDGDFGSLTQAAVISYQRSKGLTADGIVGPQTAAALNGSSSSSTGTSTGTSGTSTGTSGTSTGTGGTTTTTGDTSGYVVSDAQALIRTPPPDLMSTGAVIPMGTRVNITQETTRNGHSYAYVVGKDGHDWGWTLQSNLSSGKEHDDSMAPDKKLDTDGLSGTSLAMAQIYNSRGAYLAEEATNLRVDVEDTAAVLKAESGGKGFSLSGDMIIRFENHIFYDYWGKSNPTTFGQHFKYSSSKRWEGHYFREDAAGAWETFHGNQASEWEVLEYARTLDDTAALKSISMGAAQIMGFNYATQGFSTVQEMFEEMNGGIRPQLEGMFTFIANNSTCMTGLRTKDYEMFARGYNGSGQAAYYGGLIESYAGALERLLTRQGIS